MTAIASRSFSAFFSHDSARAPQSDGQAAAYARGYDDGQRSAEASALHRSAAALEELGARIEAISADVTRQMRALERDCAALTINLARQFAAGCALPEAKIEAAIRAVLADVADEPVLQIAVHPDLAEAVSDRISQVLARYGASARPSLEPDAALALGDCRLTWRGGALRTDAAAVEARIAAEFARAFSSEQTEPCR